MTERLDAKRRPDLLRAAQLLRGGGTVAFPTETVYGLGANAFDPGAVARVFASKGRPTFDPLIVHIADRADLPRLLSAAALADPRVALLADACWPGPLTIVAEAAEGVPGLVRSGLPTVAVRLPRLGIARDLIREAGVPIAAPSANRFGRLSPTRAEHVLEQLDGRIDAILAGDASEVGVESTVVALVRGETARLLRPGGVPLERLEELLAPHGGIEVAGSVLDERTALPGPGMTAAHYAPRAAVRLATPEDLAAACAAPPRLARIALLAPDAVTLARLQSAAAAANLQPVAALALSRAHDERVAAGTLFDALHRLDAALGGDPSAAIVAAPYPAIGLGRAIADRLQRAAAAGTDRREE